VPSLETSCHQRAPCDAVALAHDVQWRIVSAHPQTVDADETPPATRRRRGSGRTPPLYSDFVGRLYPLPTGSVKTRALSVSQVSWLLISAVPIAEKRGILPVIRTIRFGPKPSR
jgi:hypothetical protein